MPVNKNKKKTNLKKESDKKKKSSKKIVKKQKTKTDSQIDKEMKKEIKEAVKHLPGLIAEQIQFEQPEEIEEEIFIPPKKEFSRPRYETEEDRKKRRLIWIPVIAITSLIFAMWAWNVLVLFGDTNKSQEDRKGIFEIAKESYSEVMNQDVGNSVKEDLEQKQKENDQKLKAALQKSLDDLAVNLVSKVDTINTTSTININTTTSQ